MYLDELKMKSKPAPAGIPPAAAPQSRLSHVLQALLPEVQTARAAAGTRSRGRPLPPSKNTIRAASRAPTCALESPSLNPKPVLNPLALTLKTVRRRPCPVCCELWLNERVLQVRCELAERHGRLEADENVHGIWSGVVSQDNAGMCMVVFDCCSTDSL